MTFRETFYAEQLFLKKAKRVIDLGLVDNFDDEQLAERAVAVLSSALALEALANRLFEDTNCLINYDDMGIKAKIEVLGKLSGVDVNYGKEPWQHISRLISVRNWLAHYKNPSEGLVGSGATYIKDEQNKPPSLAPLTALDAISLQKYYTGVKDGIFMLAEGFSVEAEHSHLKDEYSYLKDEDYRPRLLG